MTATGCLPALVVAVVSWSVLVSDAIQLQQYTASSTLTHIAVDYNSGNIFLGGENVLLALGKDLKLIQERTLGPVLDTPNCFASPAPCGSSKNYVSNFVKTLLLNAIHNYLLVCGTVGQGSCSIHSVADLNHILAFDTTHHASFVGSTASSVAFFGKPPAGYATDRRMLYVAIATYDRTKDKFSPYTISTREIMYNNSYASIDYLIDNDALSDYSYLSVFHSVQKNFKAKYIYGFELNGYGYYISIQPIDADSAKTRYVTKLIQFCQDDRYYKTYVEIPLTCSAGATVYTIALAAYLSVSGTEDILAVSFGRPGTSHDSEPEPAYGSVVCNFSMRTARELVQLTQNRCYNGGAGTYPWWIYGYQSDCSISIQLFVPDNYCTYDRTQRKIGVSAKDEDPNAVFNEAADICLDEMVTSIVLTTQMQHPIVVLGTHDGQIIKASMKGGNCETNVPYMRFHLSLTDGIQQQMALDAEQKYAYVLAGNTVSQFPLDSCAVYFECATCVSSRGRDPLGCGWCGNHCSTRDQCVDPNTAWSHDTCQPIISSIFPSSGPTAGGTLLTIKGNSFGAKIPEVFIGDTTDNCVISKSNNSMITCTTFETTVTGEFSVTVTARDLTMDTLRYKVDGTAKTTDIKFDYKMPTLDSVTPNIGPKSGGTKVTLVGTHLNIGLSQSVSIGSAQCDITGMNATVIECLTQKAPTLLGSGRRRKRLIQATYIILAIDGAQLSGDPRNTFQYMADSTISNVFPLMSIHSGGTTVTVTGQNLHIVQKPQIGVIMSNVADPLQEDCVPEPGGRTMYCRMPSIMPVMHNLDQTKLHAVNIFFVMDNIQRLRDFISTQRKLSQCVYFPNPKLYKFDGEETLLLFDVSEDILEIKGENLDLGILAADYHVTVGRNACNMTSLKETKLTCRPQKPPSVGENEPRRAVEVKVGTFLEYDIGKLVYVAAPIEEAGISMGIIALVVILVLILSAIILLFVVMKRKQIGPFRDKEAEALHYVRERELLEGQRLLDQNRSNAYAEQGAEGSGAGNFRQGLDEETIAMLNEQNLLIERQRLQMGKQLGQGHFGSVFEGFLTFPDQKGDDLVAVKTLHQDSPREIDVMAFTKEALIMKDFNHPNVLSLIGLCLGMDDMPLVILPYMEHGDLLSYIRDETKNPTIKDLINFSIDICDGMTYLSERKFVHRDLAARNCMLDAEFKVEVADFGLSRDIYEKDYYACESKKTMLPVKWMALECLEKGKYSSKSDVWSFGIVIWELLTRGVNPYPEVDNWDIVRYLKHGRRMPQPQYCPDHLYQIMRKCWLPNPKDRPTFAQIGLEIRDMLTMMEHTMHQGEESVDIDQTYVNMDRCTDYHYTDELMPPGSPLSDDDAPPDLPAPPVPMDADDVDLPKSNTEVVTEDTEYLQPSDIGDRNSQAPSDDGDKRSPKGKSPKKPKPAKKPKKLKKQLSKGSSMEEAPSVPDKEPKVKVKPETTVAGGGQGDSVA